MLTIDANEKEVKEKTRVAIEALTKDEFIGLITMILGDYDVRMSNIWDSVEPIFIEVEELPYPIPHPYAVIEMGVIATEKRAKDES